MIMTWLDVANVLTGEKREHLARLDDDGIDPESILLLARHYMWERIALRQ
jgi:hypothetical protein